MFTEYNKEETNKDLLDLVAYAEEHKVPIIKKEGISFINQIIKVSKAKKVLEIGTAIGYSAINMALNSPVFVTSIERDENMYNLAIENIKNAGLEDKITVVYGDALEVEILEEFDLIFIDAAKAQYEKFFVKFSKNLRQNGLIIADNLGFHNLTNEEHIESKNLRNLVRKINNFKMWLKDNDEFDTYIYNIGDGMSLSIKK